MWLCVSESSILYTCVCVCERVNVHGSVHLHLCVGVCMPPCVFESRVLHNSDIVCNILQSLDCLFMENVQ